MSDPRMDTDPVEINPDLHEIFGMNPNDPAVVLTASDSAADDAGDGSRPPGPCPPLRAI